MFKTCKKPPMSIISASGSICTFNALQEGLPLKSHTIALTATQSGSGTPSPDNVRTINGYSEINNNACGVNFVSIADRAESTLNGITSEITNSRLVATGHSTGNGDIVVYFNNALVIKSGMSLTFTIDGTDNRSASLVVFLHKKGGSYLSFVSMANTSHSLTLTAEGVYDYVLLRTTNTQTVNIDAYIMIGTSTEYVPYVGSYKTIQIGSTVYGGEYDAITGVLTVTHEIVDLDTLSYTSFDSSGDVYRYYARLSGLKYAPTRTIRFICSCFKDILPSDSGYTDNSIYNYNNDNRIIIATSEATDTTELQTIIQGQKLVYELATPQTIQLPPCPIETLLGENNIWADTGNTSLEAIKIGR